jgi:tetratricopeptide (TPR) repeat protein
LGALAYWMLTGRHAYPAYMLQELQRLWRDSPPAPKTLVPDVPEALDDLVMALLHVERASRPTTAAEVIERLCTIAGLPMEEQAAVTEAYLATPTLVGREEVLRELHDLHGDSRKQGAVVLIEGESGAGRSRMLDAYVLEAKLSGKTVARVDADDSGGRDYAVVRALAAQLCEILPTAYAGVSVEQRALLAHVLPDCAPHTNDGGAWATPSANSAQPERRHLQTALRDFLLALSSQRALLLAVDDFERVDEPSAAVLVALADASRNSELSLLFTAALAGEAGTAIELLREIATCRELVPLSAAQTEALLRSVFGEVDHLVGLAVRVHELAAGNPRASMELARHMVARGLARYEAGRWTLPQALGPDDLPPTLAAAQRARIATLQGDTRELLEALSLCKVPMVVVADYPSLTEHRDRGRTYRALDDALSLGILVPAGAGFRFGHQEWVTLLRAGITNQRQRAMNARIAQLVERWGDAKSLAQHLFEAGEAERAIEVLLSQISKPYAAHSPALLSVLARACTEAERLGLPTPVQHRLRIWMVAIAAIRGDLALFQRYASAMLPSLRRESGLDDWHALDNLPEPERLRTALQHAQLRYDQMPTDERGFAPGEAITQLARLSMAFVSMLSVVQEISLTEEVPSLLPFCPLTPGLAVLHSMTELSAALRAGRTEEGRQIGLRALERLEQPDRAGLDADPHLALCFGLRHSLGLVEAASGMSTAAERVAPLEAVSGHRVNAWRDRMIAHVMQGDMVAARACQRRAELLELEDGQLPYPGTSAQYEAFAHWYTHDLMGIKGATERLGAVARHLPAFAPLVQVSRSHYLRLRGDLDAALSTLEPALRDALPGRHRHWTWVAAAHVQALDALGLHEEAVTRGLEYLAICERERFEPNHRIVALPLIEAFLAADHVEQAEQLAERCIAEIEAAGVTGLLRGAAYEARARVAIARGDGAAFERCAECCAALYQHGHNRALRAKYERLLRDAQQAGLTSPSDLKATVNLTSQLSGTDQTTEVSSLSRHSDVPEAG